MGSDFFRLVGVEVECGRLLRVGTADFGHAGAVGGGDRRAAGHCFQRRKTETFIEGGEDVNGCGFVEGGEFLFAYQPGENYIVIDFKRLGLGDDFFFVKRVFAAGYYKVAVKIVFVHKNLECFEQVGKVFVAAPDSGI